MVEYLCIVEHSLSPFDEILLTCHSSNPSLDFSIKKSYFYVTLPNELYSNLQKATALFEISDYK